jgi:pilus assembly protein CpaB
MARRSALMLVALVVAGLGTAMILLYVQGVDARAAEGQTQVTVLTATAMIEPGESLADAKAAGKLEEREVARDDAAAGALDSTATIEDQVALGTIYPDQQILGQQWGDPAALETLGIPEGQLAVSVELTDPARVAGFVSPGSWVAIFASGDPEMYLPDGSTRKLAPYTRILLPKVQVIGVGDTSVSSRTTKDDDGKETTEQIPRTILTIAVRQEQAEKVIYAARNGDLSFALRTDKSVATDNRGVTALDIMPEIFGGAR